MELSHYFHPGSKGGKKGSAHHQDDPGNKGGIGGSGRNSSGGHGSNHHCKNGNKGHSIHALQISEDAPGFGKHGSDHNCKDCYNKSEILPHFHDTLVIGPRIDLPFVDIQRKKCTSAVQYRIETGKDRTQQYSGKESLQRSRQNHIDQSTVGFVGNRQSCFRIQGNMQNSFHKKQASYDPGNHQIQRPQQFQSTGQKHSFLSLGQRFCP